MTANLKEQKFFVVGGPVQPDRPCYVLRDADAELYKHLMDGEYCYVVAPYHMGKTSLMAHTASRLGASGRGVATIDLAQISNRDVSDDVGRWYYSVAYRICRALRIKSDMQTWWQERSALTNLQRLREFFLEVVLAETEGQTIILLDRIESALEQPFALQLLGAIRACYDARATEPEYERLAFGLLGSASVGQLVPSGFDSPFDVAREVKLPDLDPAGVRQLVGGLKTDPATAAAVSSRVYEWTSGHPYLCQKILRAIARRAARPLTAATVDQVAGQLFLTRNAPAEEAHLSVIAGQLLRESASKVARLTLYGRVRKGAIVAIDPLVDVHRDLLHAGILVPDDGGQHRVRNRVYREAFTAHWVNENLPFGWQGVLTAAAVAIVLVGLPFWYSQVLPRSYVDALTAPNQDYVTALESYRRLSILPGFGSRADELFSDYLARQSRLARSLVEAERFRDGLAELPGGIALGEQLVAEYWDRRAKSAQHAGARDAALMFASRANEISTPRRRGRLAELVGNDIEQLLGTLRTAEPLRALQWDPDAGVLTGLDAAHHVNVWQLTDALPRRIQALDLLAEEIIPLQQRVVFGGAGKGRRLQLSFELDHPRPSDVLVELRAPSGRAVALRLTDVAAGSAIRFDSRQYGELRPLLEENVNGTWSAAFTDTLQGVSGRLVDWSLQIDGGAAQSPPATPVEPVAIPEPTVARQTASRLAPRGRRALTWPDADAVRGDILIWNLGSGEVINRIPRPADFSNADFALGDTAVLLRLAQSIELWTVDSARRTLRLPVEPTLAPVLSDNGRFAVIDERVGELNNDLVVWDLANARAVGRLTTGGVAELVAIDSTGRLLAVSDGEQIVRLWSVRDGRLLVELQHGSRPTTIRFAADSRWVGTQDASHTLRLWSLDAPEAPALVRHGSSDWAYSVQGDALLFGSLDKGFSLADLVSGQTANRSVHHGLVADRGRGRGQQTLLIGDASLAITYDGNDALKFWRTTPLPAPTSSDTLFDTRMAVDPGGQRLAIASGQGDVRILGYGDGPLLLAGVAEGPGFVGHRAPVTAMVFGLRGETVASGASDGTVRLWDAVSGAPRSFFVEHPEPVVQHLAFGAGDSLLISATSRSLKVTDTQSGELLAQTQIQADAPRVTASRDGERIYVAGDRGGLTRWNWRADIRETLIAPDSDIRRVAIDAGERLIVTADGRRRLRVWDAESMVARERRERAAADVDELWVLDDGRTVIAQGGAWLHSFSITESGLLNRSTRFVETPAAMAPDPDAAPGVVVVTRQGTSSPAIRRVALDRMQDGVVRIGQGWDHDEIAERLALTLDRWGEPAAVTAR